MGTVQMAKMQNRLFFQKLLRWMPGLANFFSYKKEYWSFDIKAGLSVAAVSLPVSIAYAELTGVGAIAGLYSTMLPLVVYALFGSSRQLIIGPDTATCAVVAAVVIPLAADNPVMRWQLVIILTIMIGIWCLIAGKLRLGALADLLSRPILLGLLNGISVTIIIDQLAKVLGFKYEHANLFERIAYFPYKILDIQFGTALASLLTFTILILVKKFRPRYPAPLIAVVLLTFFSWLLDFEQYGIHTIGQLSTDVIPFSSWMSFDIGLTRGLVVPSINISVICFISMMITVQSFAAKNNYDTDPDTEFKALGLANIVAGLSQGFVVSGTSSRTAVNDINGGKTQMVSIIAAAVICVVVFTLLSPLQYIPVAVLGVILIYSSWSLIDLKTIRRFFQQNRDAFYLSLTTFIAVLLIGIISGMALAVLLGIFLFLRRVFRPSEQLLGVDEEGRIHSLSNSVKPIPNTILYRFNSPLTYFNIAYFKKRVINLIDQSPVPIRYIVVDAIPSFTYQDISVLIGIEELQRPLKVRETILVLAGRRKTLKRWFSDMNIKLDNSAVDLAYDLYFAVKSIQSKEMASSDEVDSATPKQLPLIDESESQSSR